MQKNHAENVFYLIFALFANQRQLFEEEKSHLCVAEREHYPNKAVETPSIVEKSIANFVKPRSDGTEKGF